MVRSASGVFSSNVTDGGLPLFKPLKNRLNNSYYYYVRSYIYNHTTINTGIVVLVFPVLSFVIRGGGSTLCLPGV